MNNLYVSQINFHYLFIIHLSRVRRQQQLASRVLFTNPMKIRLFEFTMYNSRHIPKFSRVPSRGIYRDRFMQIIIVVIIPRRFLGVCVSPRIYCSCIKARVYDRSAIARCFSAVFPNRYSLNDIPAVQSNFSSNYKCQLNNKCSLNHGSFL